MPTKYKRNLLINKVRDQNSKNTLTAPKNNKAEQRHIFLNFNTNFRTH